MRQTTKLRTEKDSEEAVQNQEYLRQVLRKLNKSISDSNAKKSVKVTVDFYFDNAEDLGGYDADAIESTFHFLKKKKYIKNYLKETLSKDIFEEGGELKNGYTIEDIRETIYDIKYECELIPEKITDYSKELSILPKYFVRFDTNAKNPTLTLNDKYVLSHPRYGGPTYDLLETFYEQPRQKLTRIKMEKMIGEKNRDEYKFSRRLAGILADLGFETELRKIFFPRTSQEAIYFRNDIFLNEIKGQKINFNALERQLSALKLL